MLKLWMTSLLYQYFRKDIIVMNEGLAQSSNNRCASEKCVLGWNL